MAQFALNKVSEELIIAADQKIVFVDITKRKITHVIKLPENLLELIVESKEPNIEDDDETPNNEKNGNKLKNLQLGRVTIQNVAISPNGKILGVSTGGIKTLILYSQQNLQWQILSVRKSSRTSSVIAFSPNSEMIVLCDKSGDCFFYDCNNVLLSPKWILGHLSSLYDVKFSIDSKYILTADRDEKVRITNFPNSYEIENYCLGHKEYVCSIKILQNHPDILVSLSGDKTLKVWKWKDGVQLSQHSIPAPGVNLTIRTLNENSYELAVLVYQPNDCLFVCRLDIGEDSSVEIKDVNSICLESAIVTSIAYVDKFLIASIFSNNKLEIGLFKTDTNVELNSLETLKKKYRR